MKVYEDDSDHFTKEWLGYLDTLTCEVLTGSGKQTARISTDPQGRIVRIEVWYPTDTDPVVYGYHDLHLPGWMKP